MSSAAQAVTHPCHRLQSDRTSENYRAFCDANYNDAELNTTLEFR